MPPDDKATIMTNVDQSLLENDSIVSIGNHTVMNSNLKNYVVTIADDNEDSNDDDENQLPSNGRYRPSNEYVLNFAFYSFVGFLAVQTVFALIAHSQSMLADSEAMSVDAVTYLFNLVAEKIKKRPFSDSEKLLPPAVCQYNREIRRLYSELIPPALSVATLIVVTIYTLRESLGTLRGLENDDDGEDVSVVIMLIFSGANLVLDLVNVSCFARANSLFGLAMVRTENTSIRDSLRNISLAEIMRQHNSTITVNNDAINEKTSLLLLSSQGEERDTAMKKSCCNEHCFEADEASTIESREVSLATTDSGRNNKPQTILSNLNMCSAWTHICADTLRSTAVLFAAGIAFAIPAVDNAVADSVAAVVVSIIILGSLIPLIQGLVVTALEILVLHKNPPKLSLSGTV